MVLMVPRFLYVSYFEASIVNFGEIILKARLIVDLYLRAVLIEELFVLNFLIVLFVFLFLIFFQEMFLVFP